MIIKKTIFLKIFFAILIILFNAPLASSASGVNICNIPYACGASDNVCPDSYMTVGVKCDKCDPNCSGTSADCVNLVPNSVLSMCNAVGTTYFKDKCASCTAVDDTSVCRSSGTGCTADVNCDGVTPNTEITKCGGDPFADKCSSSCSAVNRGDNICRSSAVASDWGLGEGSVWGASDGFGDGGLSASAL